jgi:hypothetical protein
MAFTGMFGDGDALFSDIEFGADHEASGGNIDVNVSNTITLTDFADPHIFQPLVADTLSMTDSVLMYGDRQVAASNTISLTDTGRLAGFPIHVSSVLSITDLVTQQLRIEHVADTLNLTQTIGVSGTRSFSTSSHVDLTDTVDIHFGVANQIIEDVLDGDGTTTTLLRDTVNLTWELSLQNTLSLTDSTARIIAVHDVLALAQSASTARGGLDEEDSLFLEDTVFVQAIYGRTVPEALDIEQAVTFFIDETGKECQYNPFLGEGSPVSPTPPTLGHATLTLTYPFVSPTTTLVLRNPDFGNQESLSFDRIVRTTRGGDLEVFADPDWAKTQTLKLTVTDLTAQQAEDFLTLLGDSLGLEIGLLDWENRQWKGIITTPDAEVTNKGRCKREITFEFEGELV